MRRGNEEVCVFEIVRPGMEDSESAEKQENTGIGPASACRGESAAGRRRAVCMVNFAARDVRRHPEERGCRDVSQTRTRVRASRRMRTAAAWPSCFETHRSAFGVRKRLRSRRAAMLLSMRGGEHQPAAVRNRDRRNFHCFRLILSMEIATPTCSASKAHITPICHPRCGTSVCVTTRRHHVAPSVVIPCVTIRRHNMLCI